MPPRRGECGVRPPRSPAPGGGGRFNGVSCTDATDCTAVGVDGNGEPIYATETGGVWGPATEVTARGWRWLLQRA